MNRPMARRLRRLVLLTALTGGLLCGSIPVGAAPDAQAAPARGSGAAVSFITQAPPAPPNAPEFLKGLLGRIAGLYTKPFVSAYVQVYQHETSQEQVPLLDARGTPVPDQSQLQVRRRTASAVAGLPKDAFTLSEDNEPIDPKDVVLKSGVADEPVALVVIADTSDREWLSKTYTPVPGTSPDPRLKYTDQLSYLRDATALALRDFPASGLFAVYSMTDTPPSKTLADRGTALNQAVQLQKGSNARLLERLDDAIDALSGVTSPWRRIIIVLSDGNAAEGRLYREIEADAVKEQISIFMIGTTTAGQAQPLTSMTRLTQVTGGQLWLFPKESLQSDPGSTPALEQYVAEAVKAIKGAYKLEYRPPTSGKDLRDLKVAVTVPQQQPSDPPNVTTNGGYRALYRPVTTPAVALGVTLLVLLVIGTCVYVVVFKPTGAGIGAAETDYYLIPDGDTRQHVEEEKYLTTAWQPLGRGRGALNPEDPFFYGISKTHAFIRVSNLQVTKNASGMESRTGKVEVKVGKSGSGRGINTAFVFNDLAGPKLLSERPYELSKGDVIILQRAEESGVGPDRKPLGVRFRLGWVGSTTVGSATTGMAPAGAQGMPGMGGMPGYAGSGAVPSAAGAYWPSGAPAGTAGAGAWSAGAPAGGWQPGQRVAESYVPGQAPAPPANGPWPGAPAPAGAPQWAPNGQPAPQWAPQPAAQPVPEQPWQPQPEAQPQGPAQWQTYQEPAYQPTPQPVPYAPGPVVQPGQYVPTQYAPTQHTPGQPVPAPPPPPAQRPAAPGGAQ